MPGKEVLLYSFRGVNYSWEQLGRRAGNGCMSTGQHGPGGSHLERFWISAPQIPQVHGLRYWTPQPWFKKCTNNSSFILEAIISSTSPTLNLHKQEREEQRPWKHELWEYHNLVINLGETRSQGDRSQNAWKLLQPAEHWHCVWTTWWMKGMEHGPTEPSLDTLTPRHLGPQSSIYSWIKWDYSPGMLWRFLGQVLCRKHGCLIGVLDFCGGQLSHMWFGFPSFLLFLPFTLSSLALMALQLKV